ncbi:MAG: hypothetical protein PWQ96_2292 [Clostridia bacterium]|nr:serine/threonine dehydratase [Clostridiales bacterium]MDK2986648.1 hypothetical protein [Clostridia bacterium]
MVTKKDIIGAREAIKDKVHYTPVFHSTILSKQCGYNLYMKAENLQKTGSFKIRGATNRLTNALNEGSLPGVITASSGNHGQAVAYVAQKAKVPCTVVMPENAPQAKIDAAKNYGAEIIFCGTTSQERLDKAQKLANEKGHLYIPPYDHPHIIAGQGTIGLEILEQVSDVQAVLVPIGGGGLLSGIVTAIKESAPQVKVYGVEPQFSNSMYISLQEGKITARDTIDTIADGLRSKQPGDLTFPIVKKYVDDILLVTDEEIIKTMKLIMQYQKLVVEPSGATATAAVLFNKLPSKYKTVTSIISGGNIDFSRLASLITQ